MEYYSAMTWEEKAVSTTTGNGLDQSVVLASDPAYVTALKWEINRDGGHIG